jgi:hypothetical protein
MNTTLFEAVLSKLTVVGKPDRQGNYTAFCPFHPDQKHPNLKVHPQKGYYCFACPAKGSIKELAERLGIITSDFKEASMEGRIETQAEAMELLRKRGLRDDTIAHFRTEPDLEKQAWRYPVIQRGETKAGRYKRFPNRRGSKYWWVNTHKTFPVYGLDDIQGKREGYLVEGEPDCWIMYQAGLPAITFPFGAGTIPSGAFDLLRENGIEKLNLIYDLDKPGRDGASKVAQALESEGFRVSVRMLPRLQPGHKDINDLYLESGCDDTRFREVIAGLKEVVKDSEPQILHPALEVRPDLALVGFRQRTVVGEEVQTSDVIFMATSEGIREYSGNITELSQGKAIIDLKGKTLPFATERVSLPELRRWVNNPTPVNPGEVYCRIKAILKRLIYLQEPAYGLVPAWVMGTYFYYAFGAYPFLLFLGQKETGKTNTLFVLSQLCFNAFRASYLTSPALADTTDTLRGTLLLDQAKDLDRNPELLDILADSYKREGGIRRVVTITKSGRKVDVFNSFSPKAFASTDNLPEDLADRCFTIHMTPASHGLPDPSASQEDWKNIRIELTKLLLSHYGEVYELAAGVDREESRFGELWLPIEVMFRLAKVEAEEVERVKAFCAEQFSQVKFELGDWDQALVEAVRDSPDEVSASELLQSLIKAINPGEKDAQPGAKWLGKALQRSGLIKSKTRRQEKGREERFYTLNKEQAGRLLTTTPGEKGGSKETDETATWRPRYENGRQVPPMSPSDSATKTQLGDMTQSYAKAEVAKSPSPPSNLTPPKKDALLLKGDTNIDTSPPKGRETMLYTDDGELALAPMEYLAELCYIALDDDWAKKAPPGFVVYTEEEARQLQGASDQTKRLVHEAKRQGAKVINRE